LNECYIDFFQGRPQYLAYGWYNPIFEYEFSAPPQKLISSVYWNDNTSSANNGLISSGFMNFGSAGIILYSIILGSIFKFFNKNFNDRYTAISILFVFVFITSFFITSFLSHGIILFLIFIKNVDFFSETENYKKIL